MTFEIYNSSNFTFTTTAIRYSSGNSFKPGKLLSLGASFAKALTFYLLYAKLYEGSEM